MAVDREITRAEAERDEVVLELEDVGTVGHARREVAVHRHRAQEQRHAATVHLEQRLPALDHRTQRRRLGERALAWAGDAAHVGVAERARHGVALDEIASLDRRGARCHARGRRAARVASRSGDHDRRPHAGRDDQPRGNEADECTMTSHLSSPSSRRWRRCPTRRRWWSSPCLDRAGTSCTRPGRLGSSDRSGRPGAAA